MTRQIEGLRKAHRDLKLELSIYGGLFAGSMISLILCVVTVQYVMFIVFFAITLMLGMLLADVWLDNDGSSRLAKRKRDLERAEREDRSSGDELQAD